MDGGGLIPKKKKVNSRQWILIVLDERKRLYRSFLWASNFFFELGAFEFWKISAPVKRLFSAIMSIFSPQEAVRPTSRV